MERRAIPGYEVGGPIGFGAGGAAVAVRDRQGRSLAAIVVARDGRLEGLTRLVGLNHAHLPVIRDVVPVDDDSVAVVMDLVVGPSLATLVNARSWLSHAEVATLWRGLADALAALHHRGIVHGDVSPANVVVRSDGIPVLVDIVGHGGAERGHTGYVPPELDDSPATTASDVWSLARTVAWASGEDGAVTARVGDALAHDPQRRPAARDFATWAFLLGDSVPLEVPAAADLAGAQLRAAAAPTVLQEARVAPSPPRWTIGALAAAVGLAGLLLLGRALAAGDMPGPARAVATAPAAAGARTVVAGVLADRDAALAAGDDDAVGALYVPGAPAAEVDAGIAAALAADGTILEDYGTDLIGAEAMETRSRAVTARLELQQRAHRRSVPGGHAEFVDRQDVRCVVIEMVHRGTWLIADLTPCRS